MSAAADRPKRATSLWVAVGVLFAMMALAWYFMFTTASRNPIESVPLEHTVDP